MDKKAKKGDYLDILLRLKSSVFSTKDIALLWRDANTTAAQERLNYYVNNEKLIRIRRGIYAKDANYNKYELATKILRPSYISFETVLGASGITFQYYGNIFVASYINREIKVDEQKITFVRMKDYVLSNTMGIEHKDGIAMATKERAFLDRIYVSKDYYFDNTHSLDWNKIFEILPIYHNKSMEKKVKEHFNNYQKLNK